MMQVNKVSEFNFRGATIKINSIAAKLTVAQWRKIQSASVDAASISKTYRKWNHEVGNRVQGSCHIMRSALSDVNYTVEILMQDEHRSFTCRSMDREARLMLLRKRRHILDSLRNTKRRYDPVQERSLSPRSIFYRYAGPVNDRLHIFGSDRVGYVHAKPNQILHIAQARASRRMFEAVRPLTAERHVGIEIECGIKCSKEQLGFKLKHLAGYVMIKNDGSVSVNQREAVELNVCAPISRYKEILKGVTDVLNGDPEVSARVNKTCGLHVHLDVREWRNDFNALSDKYARLISVQGILYSMQPQSRQDNTYCKKTKSRSIVRGASRYQGINAQSIWKYTTIETRLHAGTTDYTKITNWVDLIAGVMYSTSPVPKRALTRVESIFKYFPIASSLLGYINQRVRQFTDSHAEEAEVSAA
jgi:hypothetical protein